MPKKVVDTTIISHNYAAKVSMSVFHDREMCRAVEDLEREMVNEQREEKRKTKLELERDGLIQSAMNASELNQIDIDKIRHIIVDGVIEIFYNAKPNAPQPEWVKLDTDIGIAHLLKEKEDAEAEVAKLQLENIHLREIMDSAKVEHTPLTEAPVTKTEVDSDEPTDDELADV